MKTFAEYYPLWQRDRDDAIGIFLAKDPHVSEFENKIKHYENLAVEINSKIEYIPVGPLAIFTGKYFLS